MRIGISILTREGHNIWSNGIDQNVYHLACLLQSLEFVEKVVLLDCGNIHRAPDFSGGLGSAFEIIPILDIQDDIDVAIEVSGGLNVEWVARFRARGGKVVLHVCGQPYTGLVDPTTFKRPGFFSDAERSDEVWILAKDAPFSGMLEAIHRCPVYEVPYLWAPVFLDETIAMVEQEGRHFGYQPGALRVGHAEPAIFEPNISSIKMGILPFLICDQIEKSDPQLIKSVHFMNSARFATHPTFVPLIGNTLLYKTGKARLLERDYFAKVMGFGGNLVVSHQLTCPQNYLYLDTLYGGYPLIHNSPLFSDVGYYYQDCDVDAGVAQMRLAISEHDHNLATYQQRARTKINALSPQNAQNRTMYARRLLALTSAQKKRPKNDQKFRVQKR